MNDVVPPELAGKRLDQVLVHLYPDFSRSRLTTWIREGRVLLDGSPRAPKYRVLGGERLATDFEAPVEEDETWTAEAMDLEIVYADEQIFVINKP
ncbi:MAG: S4 domain-containing protein, partial [Gammaproteobacteria bacterium]